MLILNICNIVIWVADIENMQYLCIMGKKQERTVIHLELEGRHYYYGNIKALCDSHSKDEIGIGYGYLRNYGLSTDHPYTGKKCIIRKGTIVTSPRSTSVSERNTEFVSENDTTDQ